MDNSDELCAICLLKLNTNNNTYLECGHKYHHKCIKEWCKVNSTCPICRQNMNVKCTYNNTTFLVPLDFKEKMRKFFKSFKTEASKLLMIQSLLAITKSWHVNSGRDNDEKLHVQCDSFIDNTDVLHMLVVKNMKYSNSILKEAHICFNTLCL